MYHPSHCSPKKYIPIDFNVIFFKALPFPIGMCTNPSRDRDGSIYPTLMPNLCIKTRVLQYKHRHTPQLTKRGTGQWGTQRGLRASLMDLRDSHRGPSASNRGLSVGWRSLRTSLRSLRVSQRGPRASQTGVRANQGGRTYIPPSTGLSGPLPIKADRHKLHAPSSQRPSNGWTNQQMDQPTNGPTNQQSRL